MRHLARSLLNTLAAVSLLLCVASSLVWASRLDPAWEINFQFRVGKDIQNVRLTTGYNFVYIEHEWPDSRDVWMLNFHPPIAFNIDTTHFNWPVQVPRSAFLIPAIRRRYEIGFGYFPAVFIILPLICWLPPIIRLAQTRFHRPPGLCPKCGYDLRATPDRCPECGTIPNPPNVVHSSATID